MVRQPHPTDGMTDEQKQAYFSQKTISREVQIVVEPRMGMIGGKVNDFTKQGREEVKQANDLL